MLIDTNIVSELMQREPDENVLRWAGHQSGFFLSVIAYEELVYGLSRRNLPVATDSEKRRQVNPRKIYPVDTALGPVFDRSGKSNTGHVLEVAVHGEHWRRGAEVAYVRTPAISRNPPSDRDPSGMAVDAWTQCLMRWTRERA